MFGEKRCVGYGADSIVYADFDNGPALAIQAGQGTRIKDLSFEGVNVWYENWPSFDVGGVNVTDDSYLLKDLFNESGITGGSCVDTAHAPYAGIAIDPFSLGQSGNYMPLHRSRWTGRSRLRKVRGAWPRQPQSVRWMCVPPRQS